MTKKKVLYISYDGMTDPLGQSQVLPYLTGLSRNHYEITIISAEKPDAFEKHEHTIRNICQQYQIKWCPVKYHKFPPVISTLIDLWKMYRLAEQLIKKEKITLVHCRSYLPAMLARRLRKHLAIRWIFDMRGFWIDERVEGGIWNLKNPVYRIIYSFLKKEELKLIRNADFIVSLTNKAVPIIAEKRGSGKNIAVIPCCVDTGFFDQSLFTAEEIKSEKIKSGIPPDAYVLGYLGSYSTWYMPSEMLDFFQSLKKEEPQSYFLIITHENHTLFEELAKSKGIDLSYVVFRSASRIEVPRLLSILDSAVFFILPAYSKQASSPVKLGEFMSMGIPVLTNKGVGDMDVLFSNTDLGLSIDKFDSASLSNSAKQLLQFRTKHHHTKIRDTALQSFSLEHGIQSYLDIYSTFLPANRGDKTHS